MYRTQGAFVEDCSILSPRSRSCRRISEVAVLPKRKIHKRSGKGHAAGGLGGRLAQAQRGPERWSVNRQSLSCAWLETTRQAHHRFLYGTQTEAPAYYVPLCMYVQRVQIEIHFKPTSRITTREAPHKQNYDQEGSPQAESRPGSLCTHKQNYDQGAYPQTELCTTRELAGWLAELCLYDLGACPALGWLAGWWAGWLAEAQRGPERRSVDRTGLSCAWLEAPEGLCHTHTCTHSRSQLCL